MIHELKTAPEFFEAIKLERKTFEIRKDDRPFMVGDFLALNEYKNRAYTGKCLIVRVTYVLRDFEYCKEGYVTLGIIPCCITDRYNHFERLQEKRPVCGIPVYQNEEARG